MWRSSERRFGSFDSHSITVDQSVIYPSSSLRNRGVILRSDLVMVYQTYTVSHSCYYSLRQFRLIRVSLSHQGLRDASYTHVLLGFDCCNVLFTGSPNYRINRLQIIINTAARGVVGRSRFSGYVRDYQQLSEST